MLRAIWAFLTRQRLVILRDYDGEFTRTFAFKRRWRGRDIWFAKRHWPDDIHIVTLAYDGKVEGSKYVLEWSWDRPYKD